MATKKPAPTYDPVALDALLDRDWSSDWDTLFKTLSAAPWAATAPQWLAHADAKLSASHQDEARRWPIAAFGNKKPPAALPLVRSLHMPPLQPAKFDALIDCFARLTPQTAPPLTELVTMGYYKITRALTEAEADTIWDRLSLAPLRTVSLSRDPTVTALVSTLHRAQVLGTIESLFIGALRDAELAALLDAPQATSLTALSLRMIEPLSAATARAFAPHAQRLKWLKLSFHQVPAPYSSESLAALTSHPWTALDSLKLIIPPSAPHRPTPATIRELLRAAPALSKLCIPLDDPSGSGAATLADAPRGALRELDLYGDRADATTAALLSSAACAQLTRLDLYDSLGPLTAAALRGLTSLTNATLGAPQTHDNATLYDALRGARWPALRELKLRALSAPNMLDALETMDLPALRMLWIDLSGADSAALDRLAAIPWLYQCKLVLDGVDPALREQHIELLTLAMKARPGAPEKI